MVDNGLGVTMLPQMAIDAGLLEHTRVTARPLHANHPARQIALVWRTGRAREKEFRLLGNTIKDAYLAQAK